MSHSSKPGTDRQALANWLESNRHEIVSEWMTAVREDTKIPDADHLTLAALQDHFPEMIAELTTALLSPADPPDDETRRTAQAHGRARLRQRYRLDEVFRELTRVRELILRRVRKYCEDRILTALRNEAEEETRRFFDKVVASSAQQFMEEQEAEILLRSRQLQNAYEQAQAATEQLREIAQSRLRLLRGVSHELRNALQTLGFGTSALLEEANAERRDTLTSNLNTSAAHLQRVLDRMQEFSTILAGDARIHLKTLDLRQFVEDLRKPHQHGAECKGLVFKAGAVEVPSVTTDENKLRHIADILLSNAIQFTEHGSVEVTIRRDDDDRWIFRVTDTGIGMDDASAGRVFHEFHRSQNASHGGVGLGLIIARHLAHLMDGEITFQSKPGEGSRFEINLPVDLRGAQ